MNIGVHITFEIRDYLLRSILRSGIGGWWIISYTQFEFFEKLSTVFTHVHSHLQGTRIPFPQHPLQHVMLCVGGVSRSDWCGLISLCSWPFVTTWTDPDFILLIEVSHTKKDKHHKTSPICGISKRKK